MLILVQVPRRETRYGKLNLICPKYVRELEGGRSFQVSAAKMWDQLPIYRRKSPTLKFFKYNLFNYFSSDYKDLDNFNPQLNFLFTYT